MKENELRLIDVQIDAWEGTLKARAAFVTFANTISKNFILSDFDSKTYHFCCCCSIYVSDEIKDRDQTTN